MPPSDRGMHEALAYTDDQPLPNRLWRWLNLLCRKLDQKIQRVQSDFKGLLQAAAEILAEKWRGSGKFDFLPQRISGVWARFHPRRPRKPWYAVWHDRECSESFASKNERRKSRLLQQHRRLFCPSDHALALQLGKPWTCILDEDTRLAGQHHLDKLLDAPERSTVLSDIR